MSQLANSYDNASCESFIKTLIEKILTTTRFNKHKICSYKFDYSDRSKS